LNSVVFDSARILSSDYDSAITGDDVVPISGAGSGLDDCSSAFGISAALAAEPQAVRRPSRRYCRVCHGGPEGIASPIARGLTPNAPQLARDGVEDDPAGTISWKRPRHPFHGHAGLPPEPFRPGDVADGPLRKADGQAAAWTSPGLGRGETDSLVRQSLSRLFQLRPTAKGAGAF